MNTVVKKTGHGAEFVLTGIEDRRDMPLQLLYQDSIRISERVPENPKRTGHGAEFVLTGIEDRRDMPLQLLYQDSIRISERVPENPKRTGRKQR